MAATVIGKNVDLQEMRAIIYDITMDLQFLEYHNSRKLFRPSSSWEEELAYTQKLEKGYAIN